jgi:hypothetical protein
MFDAMVLSPVFSFDHSAQLPLTELRVATVFTLYEEQTDSKPQVWAGAV